MAWFLAGEYPWEGQFHRQLLGLGPHIWGTPADEAGSPLCPVMQLPCSALALSRVQSAQFVLWKARDIDASSEVQKA